LTVSVPIACSECGGSGKLMGPPAPPEMRPAPGSDRCYIRQWLKWDSSRERCAACGGHGSPPDARDAAQKLDVQLADELAAAC
jgi:hypothetical protein